MKRVRSLYTLVSAVALFTLVLAACTPAPAAPTVDTFATQSAFSTQFAVNKAATEAANAAATQAAIAEIGTAKHPIKVIFVPSVDAAVITTGGQVMADALKAATGLEFDVVVPTSYAATLEEMCASTNDTMGFIPGMAYVMGNQLCGVDVAFKAVRFGFPAYWAQFLVARDSTYQTLADLNGKKWGYTDAGSTSGYMLPKAVLAEAGVTPSESIATGGHNQSVQALYNGEVDFSTSFYSVPLKPDGNPWWSWDDFLAGKVTDDMWDIQADLIPTCAVSEDGKKLLCSDWRVLDARANIRAAAPDVMQKLRILAVSPAVPNDTLSFGPDFPPELRATIEAALLDFASTEAWGKSLGSADFYGWSGILLATDEEYDPIRSMAEAVGITPETYGK